MTITTGAAAPRLRSPRRSLLRAAVGASLAIAALGTGTAFAQSAPVLDDEEAGFFNTINDYRRQNGLAPLQLSPILTSSSKWMSADMANNNYFSHTDSLGRTPDVQMQAFGYPSNVWWGENIAAGNWTASGTFEQWRNSAGHNANMLNPNYTVIGIGRAYGSGTYGWYWTTDFGSYADPGTTDTPAGVTTTTSGTSTGTTSTGTTSTGTTTTTTTNRRGKRWR